MIKTICTLMILGLLTAGCGIPEEEHNAIIAKLVARNKKDAPTYSRPSEKMYQYTSKEVDQVEELAYNLGYMEALVNFQKVFAEYDLSDEHKIFVQSIVDKTLRMKDEAYH